MNSTERMAIRARQGDKQAFTELYALYYVELYKYALYMLKNPEDAKDAVSETVADAYRDIGKLKNAAAFKGWIFRILSRKIIGTYKRETPIEQPEAISADATEQVILKTDLQSALMTLSETDRAIVILSACHKYNSREIGEMLGMNRQTVRSRCARAMQKLRTQLQEKEVYYV